MPFYNVPESALSGFPSLTSLFFGDEIHGISSLSTGPYVSRKLACSEQCLNELCLNTIAREIVLLRILVGAVVIAESNFTFIDIF